MPLINVSSTLPSMIRPYHTITLYFHQVGSFHPLSTFQHPRPSPTPSLPRLQPQPVHTLLFLAETQWYAGIDFIYIASGCRRRGLESAQAHHVFDWCERAAAFRIRYTPNAFDLPPMRQAAAPTRSWPAVTDVKEPREVRVVVYYPSFFAQVDVGVVMVNIYLIIRRNNCKVKRRIACLILMISHGRLNFLISSHRTRAFGKT